MTNHKDPMAFREEEAKTLRELVKTLGKAIFADDACKNHAFKCQLCKMSSSQEPCAVMDVLMNAYKSSNALAKYALARNPELLKEINGT